ncbi:8874_t:CDS:1, partial [Scutellospora calospora]
NRQQIEAAGFLSIDIEKNRLFKDIMKAYSLYYSLEQALLKTRVYFYENVIYTITNPNSDYYNIKLEVSEIVEAKLHRENEWKFSKITSIIKHL